ncbi:hypothetical protein EV421DRAFT_1743066 [Armillaria borealis]|uniref:Uncharacterized protein n=1 Tax=Armillaria borealis TaxID=47425 RepID=A0AA39IX82_9AGAR|nr:hypothetical protein EV421DRAFT_1743066 [Armillaria borealis]
MITNAENGEGHRPPLQPRLRHDHWRPRTETSSMSGLLSLVQGNGILERELEALIQAGELTEKVRPGRRQTVRIERYKMLLLEEEKTWTKLSEEAHAVAMNKWKAGESRKNTESSFLILTRSAGRTSNGKNFVDLEKEGDLKTVVPLFGGFLKKAIVRPDYCWLMAFPTVKGLHEIGFGDIEREGVFLHRVEDPSSSVEPSAKVPGATDFQGTEPAALTRFPTLVMVIAEREARKALENSGHADPGHRRPRPHQLTGFISRAMRLRCSILNFSGYRIHGFTPPLVWSRKDDFLDFPSWFHSLDRSPEATALDG